MDDLKITFAQNLIALRKQTKLTQAELAEKINYSDKAVSKWERGESIPDVSVLMTLANLFGVTIDFLVTKHDNEEIAKEQTAYAAKIRKRNHILITAITFFAMLIMETIVCVVLVGTRTATPLWTFLYCYIFPLPVFATIAVIFSSLWAGKYWRFTAVSFLIWSLLAEAFLIVILCWKPFPHIFLAGIPAEIVAMMSYKITLLPSNKETNAKNKTQKSEQSDDGEQ